jgi:hypothetical protein
MRLYVQLPVAIHADMKSALLISYGVGTTAKALTDTLSFKRIDMVDIIPRRLRDEPQLCQNANTLTYPDSFRKTEPGLCDEIDGERVRYHLAIAWRPVGNPTVRVPIRCPVALPAGSAPDRVPG